MRRPFASTRRFRYCPTIRARSRTLHRFRSTSARRRSMPVSLCCRRIRCSRVKADLRNSCSSNRSPHSSVTASCCAIRLRSEPSAAERSSTPLRPIGVDAPRHVLTSSQRCRLSHPAMRWQRCWHAVRWVLTSNDSSDCETSTQRRRLRCARPCRFIASTLAISRVRLHRAWTLTARSPCRRRSGRPGATRSSPCWRVRTPTIPIRSDRSPRRLHAWRQSPCQA